MSKLLGTTGLMLIGAGYHARDAYLPSLAALQSNYRINLASIVDFEFVLPRAVEFAQSLNLEPASCVAAVQFSGHQLPKEFAQHLSRNVQENQVGAVIIATPPELHKAYAMWALEMGLHILLDKPITTRPHAAHSMPAALGILRDYQELRERYDQLQQTKETAFLVHTTRRYHPAFQTILNLIEEIRELTNCPVTSSYSSHADGQWRLPEEIIDIDYHGYNQGIGVVSHTGYHIIDIATQFEIAGEPKGKRPDRIEIFSSFVTPRGLIRQMNEDDYRKILPHYRLTSGYSEDQMAERYSGFGEVDAFVGLDFWRSGDCVGHASIEMLHNGFSQRSNITPNYADLYKGMGRLNQEYHNIQQGPFQNIQMHSFQSKSPQSPSDERDFGIGGNNHRDVVVFRNSNLLNLKRYQKIAMNEMMQVDPASSVAKIVEGLVVEEFVRFLRGGTKKSELRSNIESHWLPTAIMSGVYASYVSRSEGAHPIATLDLNKRERAIPGAGGARSSM